MATGKQAFTGSTTIAVIDSILHRSPPPVTELNPALPPIIGQVIGKALEKDPQKRQQSATELSDELQSIKEQLDRSSRPVSRWRSVSRRVAVAAGISVLLLTAGSVWWGHRNSRIHWARDTAVPEIDRLANNHQFAQAFAIARQAEREIGTDPLLARVWPKISWIATVKTEPAGADIYMKYYSKPEDAWEFVGRSPIRSIRDPFGAYRWKIQKAGFETLERGSEHSEWSVLFPSEYSSSMTFTLNKSGSIPTDMLRVGSTTVSLETIGVTDVRPSTVNDFVIDRFEVTNKQFKSFLDSGGYENQKYWKFPFVKGGHTLSGLKP
jgi:eukaryotic-like serine/threonine-protein kinase